MKLSEYHLDAAYAELFMYANRYAAAVVLNGHRLISMQSNLYRISKAIGSLVNGVIYYLPQHMVQALDTGAAYVHAGTHAHSLKSFHYFDIAYIVILAHLFLQYHMRYIQLFTTTLYYNTKFHSCTHQQL